MFQVNPAIPQDLVVQELLGHLGLQEDQEGQLHLCHPCHQEVLRCLEHLLLLLNRLCQEVQ